ncbi:hypothetical protein CerSpe_149290 [Prunus speciosa]
MQFEFINFSFDLQVKHSRTGHEHDCQRLRISSQLGDSSSDETTPAVLLKVTSNNAWPEYKIMQESESSYDTDMPDDTVCTNSLVSSNRTDDALMSITGREFRGINRCYLTV